MVLQERPQSRLRLKAHNLKYVALLGVSIALVFWDVFLLQKAFLSGDHLIQHYPWAKFLQASVRHFRLPWWTSQIQCGFPLLAEGQIGAFYPPNLIFLFFFPLKWAYNYETLFHFGLGAFFFYLYLRRLGLSGEAVFFSTLIFLFGSCEGGFFYNLTSQRVSVWFPLTLYLVEGLVRKPRLRDASLLGLVFALQIFAGYQQIAIYSIAFATLYLLLRLTPFFIDQPRSERFRSLYGYGWAIFLGIAISAIQWFPMLELSRFSSRAEAQEALAYMGSPFPFFPMTLLFPDWTGFWRGGIYAGILGLFFVLWSFFTRKTGVERLWFFLFAVAFLLSFGKFSPLYLFLVKVFRLYFFRVPTKFLFFASFALAVLAGSGFDKFLRTKPNLVLLKKVALSAGGFFSVIVISIVAAHLLARVFQEPLLRILENYVATHIYGYPYHPHSLEAYQARLYAYYDFFLQLTSLRSPQTFFPILLFLGQAGVCAFWFRKREVKRAAPVFLLLLFTDLFFYAHMNTRRDLNRYDIVETKSQLVDILREDRGVFRVHEFITVPLHSGLFPFIPNRNMQFGFEDIGVYSPFAFLEYKSFLGELGGVDDSLYQSRVVLEALKSRREVLDRLNVKYLLSDVPLDLRGLKFLAEEQGIRLYENTRFWPRAFYSEKIDSAPFFESLREIPILEREEGRMVFDTRGIEKGYLVVSEQNYPGRKARSRDEALQLIPLENYLQAIPLSGGTDRVELFYEQDYKKILIWFSLMSCLFALVGLGYQR